MTISVGDEKELHENVDVDDQEEVEDGEEEGVPETPGVSSGTS